MEREVHGHARRHQPLEEAGGERARPPPEVQGAREVVPEPQVAAVYLHLDGLRLVPLGGGPAQGRGQQQAPQGAALQRVDGESRPREQGVKLLRAVDLAAGVEAPVEDALAPFEVSEKDLEGVGRLARLRGQALRLGLAQLVPHPGEVGRVLPDEELDGEVEGVEEAGEGPQLGLVQLQALHLADATFTPSSRTTASSSRWERRKQSGRAGEASVREPWSRRPREGLRLQQNAFRGSFE